MGFLTHIKTVIVFPSLISSKKLILDSDSDIQYNLTQTRHGIHNISKYRPTFAVTKRECTSICVAQEDDSG